MLDFLEHGKFLPHRPLRDNKLNIESSSMREDDYPVPGVYNWWSCDTKERYQHNLNVQDDNWHYRTKSVSYNLNSSGYRCPEWNDIDWKNSVVIFGCSETFGTGLAEDETISYQLQQLIDRPVINLGKNGTSMEYALANNLILRNNYATPVAVINHWTEPVRETYFGLDKISHVLPRHEVYYKKHFGMLNNMVGLSVDDCEHDYNFKAKMYSETCKAIWKDIDYIESTWNYLTAIILKCYKHNKQDSARDIAYDGTSHSGKATALELAKYYAERISV